MKTTRLTVLVLICALLAAISCGKSGDNNGTATPIAPPLPPPVVDHAFDNAQSALGDIPADLSASGPVISGVTIVPDSMVIQGQSLTFNVAFDDLEMDLITATLFVQVMGRSEYWTFGPDQFGGIIGGTATIDVEVSSNFEPDAYVIRIGMRDDAGHVGNIFTSIFIVLAYSTPEIVSFEPGDGQINVPLNTPVRGVFSNPVMEEPVSLTLTQNGQDVPCAFRLLPAKKVVTLVPDQFLLPGTEYVATLTVGQRTASHQFTTAVLTPVPDLTGRVYSVKITPDKILEPTGAEILFWTITIPPILVKIKTFDETNGIISSVGALGKGDPLAQDPAFGIMPFPSSGATLINPFFLMGPAVLNIDLYVISVGLIDTAVNIYGFTLTGNFTQNGDQFENVIITGYLDANEINYAVTTFMPGTGIPFNVCIQLPGACDENNLVGFRAQYLSGPYEPQVSDLYDLSVSANPTTIPRSTGGIVNVTGEYSINADPSGTHQVSLTTSHGTFPGGGSSYNINTTDGVYSTTLTVPAGLSVGTKVLLTATASSPNGNMPRKTKVTIQ